VHSVYLFNYDKLMLTANNISLKQVQNKRIGKAKRFIKLSRDTETENFSLFSPIEISVESVEDNIGYYFSQ